MFVRKVSAPFGALKRGIRSVQRLISSQYPYRVARFIEENKDKTIESMTLYRSPIMSVIKKLLYVLSFGRINDQELKKIGYDDLYHLYMIVQFSDDTRAILEKNQNINVSDDIQTRGQGAESLSVPLSNRPTLGEVLDNTQRRMGKRYFQYDFKTSNCQDWLDNLLRANALATPETTAFIKQNIGQLLETLPPDVTQTARATTQIAAVVNRGLQALGFKGFARGGRV